jgi:hypothetical protein
MMTEVVYEESGGESQRPASRDHGGRALSPGPGPSDRQTDAVRCKLVLHDHACCHITQASHASHVRAILLMDARRTVSARVSPVKCLIDVRRAALVRALLCDIYEQDT